MVTLLAGVEACGSFELLNTSGGADKGSEVASDLLLTDGVEGLIADSAECRLMEAVFGVGWA